MNEDARAAVAEAAGSPVVSATALSGGDINEAYAVKLGDGREVFVKMGRHAAPGMFAVEARGLAWLGEPGALRVPHVVAVHERALVLELIRPGHPLPSFDEDLGRGLAALHGSGAPAFGLDHDNFIGRLPQSNRVHATWVDFYRHERLEPQLKRATDGGLVPPGLRRTFSRLFALLPELCGPPEPPARLHGDLWGGNSICDEAGRPCLIDPAVYGGHREIDLAMMRLFGGFRQRTFDAYAEAFPLAPGVRERVPLYQLYPLMVHVNLFGGSYVGSVESALSALI